MSAQDGDTIVDRDRGGGGGGDGEGEHGARPPGDAGGPAPAAEAKAPGNRFSTGSGVIDELMGGGVEKGAVTELFGEAGSGKTNLCFQLGRECAIRGKKTAFIDTEGVSIERLRQICGSRFDELSRLILFYEAYGMREQEEAVDKATRLCAAKADIGLLILDSSTIFYRMGLGTDQESFMRRSLAYQLNQLLTTARRMEVPAVITTQVYHDLKKDQVCPIGGHLMQHGAKAILRLEKVGRGVRRAVICKHRSRPEGRSCLFYLTGRGIEDRPRGEGEEGDEGVEVGGGGRAGDGDGGEGYERADRWGDVSAFSGGGGGNATDDDR